MKVSYPAIFYEEKIGNYTVFFPDFQQVTCGDDLADAEFMAKDCLSLLITIENEDRHKIPKPTPIEDLDIHCIDSEDWEYVRAFVKMIEIDISHTIFPQLKLRIKRSRHSASGALYRIRVMIHK